MSVITGQDAITGSHDPVKVTGNNLHVAQYVWDTNTLAWIKQTGSSGAVGTEVVVTNLPAVQTVSGTVSVAEVVRTVRFDQSTDTVAYVGEAAVGSSEGAAAWRIKRLVTNSEGDLTITFADGNANFDNSWTNRSSLSYS